MRSRWLLLAPCFALSALIVSSLLSTAADPAPARPVAFECRWVDAPITLDGKADEPAWSDAEPIESFYLPWLGEQARNAKTATRAKLLWDREYLYFFAKMDDADLYADITEHDGQTWDNDVFELFFKPANDKPGYYEMQVSANGTRMDMFIPQRGSGGTRRFLRDGDFHWEAKVVQDGTLNNPRDQDKSWSVEGRIPWTDFLRTGGRPALGEKWKFALCRYDYSVQFEGPELSTMAPLNGKTFADFHAHEQYATLTFVGPDKSKHARPRGIEKFVPITTSTVKGWPDPPAPYRTERVFPKLKISFPIHVAHLPGSDQILVIDQPASYGPTRIARFKDDANVEQVVPLLDLTDTAYDLTFHPKFRENGYIYVGSNGSRNGGPKMTRVTRYTIERQEPYRLDPASAKVIIEWESDGHNGAAVTFGHDGMLYVTSGDGTSDSDTNVVGQDITTMLAKVLRIDVDHPASGKEYSVPKDNPFLHIKDAKPETWAFGLRNPWRMTTDAKTGHIWVAQNGQDLWEQAFLVRKGDNYGWSVTEGSHPFYENRKVGPAPIVKPTVEHHHSEARSLTGGIVYYGPRLTDLHGMYLYGDYSTGKIWGVKHDGTKVVKQLELFDSTLQITGFGTDSKGELLICDHRGDGKGGFFTLVPTPKDLPPSTFPKKLSESGLFGSIPDHRMVPGVIPYSVNAPFWSDGAYKSRFIVLPGADAKIDYSRTRGWGFPDETVIVKSFALEREEGKPETRRWIETRFLTKQQGEWFGYSYLWNEDQTDAILVDGQGLDKVFDIRTANGVKQQKWHYPSRAECMVCHSRAANYVLGLCEPQMNKEHNYGGVIDHQLRVLEHLDVLKINSQEEIRKGFREDLKARGMTEAQINDYVAKYGSSAPGQRGVGGSATMLPFNPRSSHFAAMVDPHDERADLTKRVKSYLHANCSSCHVEAGGGNAQMELEYHTPLDKMRILNVNPVHQTFNLPDAKLIAPGRPESSVMLHRISHRQSGSMPPLSTNVIDEQGRKLMETWIRSLR